MRLVACQSVFVCFQMITQTYICWQTDYDMLLVKGTSTVFLFLKVFNFQMKEENTFVLMNLSP